MRGPAFALLLLLLAPALPGQAQSAAAAKLATLPTTGTESLLIGPGDLIQISVLDTPELEQQVRVTDAGKIPLAYLGEVPVSGMTPAAAAAEVQSMLISKNVMRHPQVSVRVQEYASQDVSVLGQVRTPGSYPLTTSQPILKVLSLAGGVTDLADRRVTLRRHGTGEEIGYLLSNDPEKMLSDPVVVRPGDTVIVPKAPIVYILGDVARPGGFAMSANDPHLTMLQAIARAGSVNKTAVSSKVRLIRNTDHGQTESRIRLDDMEKGKVPDIDLQANDIIYVPFSWMKNIALSGSSIAASTSSAAIYAIP